MFLFSTFGWFIEQKGAPVLSQVLFLLRWKLSWKFIPAMKISWRSWRSWVGNFAGDLSLESLPMCP